MVNFVITLKNYLACCGELMNINIPTIYTHSKTQSGYIYSDETVPDMVNEAVKLKYFLLFYLLQGEVYYCLHVKKSKLQEQGNISGLRRSMWDYCGT